jgi:hypothetical protein
MALFSSSWKYRGNVKKEVIRPRKADAPARGLRSRPHLEPLEARLLLATDIWTGGDGTAVASALWSNSANWVDNSGHATIPTAGDDLIFPATAASMLSADDFPDTFVIHSMTILGGGYQIGAQSDGNITVGTPTPNTNRIGLVAGIHALNTTGNESLSSITLLGTQAFVADNPGVSFSFSDLNVNGYTLTLGGAADFSMGDPVFGTGGITKAGPGLLQVHGTSFSPIFDSIAFGGTVNVNEGNLEVDISMGLASVVVSSGCTLSGSGFVGPLTVNQGGTVHPGQFSRGNYDATALRVNGVATFNAGAIFKVDFGITGGQGMLIAYGGVVLNDATLVPLSRGLSRLGSFTLINNASAVPTVGTFQGLPEGGGIALADPPVNTISYDPAQVSYRGGQGGDVVVTSIPANPFQVAGWYKDILDRAPDSTGASFWLGQLNDYQIPLVKLVTSFLATPEHFAAEVDQFYSTYLHRGADPAGRAFWTNLLTQGMDTRQLVVDFLLSAEYQGLHADDTSFVQALYQDVLARAASASEVGSWQQQLAAGALNRGAVARAFVTSGEAYQDAVNQDFAQFLGRAPEAAAEEYFVTALQNGTETPARIVVDILLTGEYYNRQILRI